MDTSITPFSSLHIHGDNIVECDRALMLILKALEEQIEKISAPTFSVTCPRYLLRLRDVSKPLQITFYPGFGRWDHDILQSVRARGGVLREAADVIVTGIQDAEEKLLFAIEFCGALPAGNQAWQRSGRAYSFGVANVPYLYISELGGYELDGNRNRKASRMPNAAVPFSYLAFSIERDTPVFPIFITAPGADDESRKLYEDEFADVELIDLIRAYVLQDDNTEIFNRLQIKVLSFVKKRAEQSRRGETLTGKEWQKAFDSLTDKNKMPEFLIDEIRQAWSKTAYIDALTDRARALMDLGKKYGIGITSTKLPMCLLDTNSRQKFAASVVELFPELDAEFNVFLKRSQPLAICWVMGFKPRGDDARPDRGLAPMTRMLIGLEHEMLTIVYGPAPQATWNTLVKNPSDLSKRNGLWEAIMETSDALLVEAATDQASKKGYRRVEWKKDLPETKDEPFFVSPHPLKFGENDVDTALHLLLSQMLGADIFEGMCNPPGGDWSGVSILNEKRSTEHRWISLPRVSGPDTKRPDHVFQIFTPTSPSIILCIESKETPQSLEPGIGHRLTEYLRYLLSTPASIERSLKNGGWKHSSTQVSLDSYRIASAGAFLASSEAQILDAVSRSVTDLTFAARFIEDGKRCEIEIFTSSNLGNEIANYIIENIVQTEIISVKITD